MNDPNAKSLEFWLWDAACSIRGAQDLLLFLDKNKLQAKKDKLFLVNAAQVFAKGDPKNFIPEEGIERIAAAFPDWKEEDKFSSIAVKAKIVRNDYNISPSRYIHTGASETYRPLAEIVAELDAIEAQARETDKALREILQKVGEYERRISWHGSLSGAA